LKIKNIFKKQANKQTQIEDDIYIYLFIKKKKTNKQTTTAAKKENKKHPRIIIYNMFIGKYSSFI